MTNAIDIFFKWFNQLPYKYRMELATEVCAAHSELSLNPYHVKFLEQWENYFKQYKEDNAKLNAVIISLSQTIATVIANKNQSLLNWESEKAAIDEAAQLTGSCSLAEHAAEKALQHQVWSALQEQWHHFVNTVGKDFKLKE